MLLLAVTFFLIAFICAVGDAAAGHDRRLRNVCRVIWALSVAFAVLALAIVFTSSNRVTQRRQATALLAQAVSAERTVYASQGSYGNAVDLQAVSARFGSLPSSQKVEVALGSRSQVVRLTVRVGGREPVSVSRLLVANASR